MKEIEWDMRALKEVKSFPEEVKRKLGYLIYELQLGKKLDMPFSKPMPSLQKGCSELRIKGQDGVYRAFYFLKVEDKIIIFHAFKKKSQKTPKKELETGRKNLKEILDEKI